MRTMPKIGKGKNMSVAKAALVFFYEDEEFNEFGASFIYSGDLGPIHRIVDIAGAKHCSLFTHHQILSCLRSSPYWQVDGTITGWGGRAANCYVPSKKGEEYYNNHLKDRF